LRQLEVVSIVDTHYRKYNNDAPAVVIQRQMDDLQKLLDRKETKA
jgi:hypothetical protein